METYTIINSNNMIKSLKRNSFLVSLLLSYNIITATFSSLFNISNSTGVLVAGLITFLFIVFSISNKDFSFDIDSVLFLIFIFSEFCISFLFLSFYSKTLETFYNFLFFGALAYIIGSKKIDTQLVLRYSIYLSLLYLLTFKDLFSNHMQGSVYQRIDMGLSYALLPLVIASFIHFFYYRKNKENLVLWMGYLINFGNFIIILFLGTRGVVLSLLFFLWFLLLNKYIPIKNNKYIVKHNKKWFILSIIIILLSLLFFKQIFNVIFRFLTLIGIKVGFIEKTHFLIVTGDVSNSRNVIYDKAIQGIMKSPLWGHGIGAFENHTKIEYPHNIVLQLFYEGGLILALPFLIIITIGLIKALKGKIKNKEDYFYLVLLFSSVLIRLMVSASFWNVQILWLLLAFIIKKILLNRSTSEIKRVKN